MSKEARISKLEKVMEKEKLIDLDMLADQYIVSQKMFLSVPCSDDPEIQRQAEETVSNPFTAAERLILRQDAILTQLKYDDVHYNFWSKQAELHGLLNSAKADAVSEEARRILALRTIDGKDFTKKGVKDE